MILYELFGNEQHPVYRKLSADNLARQYDFLQSIVVAAIDADRQMISKALIAALNYHAISCLHVNAGEYRPCPVTVGKHHPPEHYRVPELMNAFINEVNRHWDATDVWTLAAYCLWRLNYLHPFINGNGRTARVLCYFVVCVKHGGWLKGEPILPELIRKERDEYVELLKSADAAFGEGRTDFLNGLRSFILRLSDQQIGSVPDGV